MKLHYVSGMMANVVWSTLSDPNEHGKFNFAAVARLSKMVPGGNIFNLRYLLFPINISDMHWILAVVFMEDRCIQYYDWLPDGSLFHKEMRNGCLAVFEGRVQSSNRWQRA
ncbi:hypothetical protein ACHAW5_001154 [Stephanodiscus triporus]|uniref:Ubiquitin-like protease family profile domain-containing protein n=1 Tax=Stephanodiscus triporus TaxID=2934178 RepID=A0ABD3QQ53_9STRA